MIHAVEINEIGVVVRGVCAPNVQWCIDHLGGTWLQTWTDGSQRGKYAGIGDVYDEQADEFVSPEPADS